LNNIDATFGNEFFRAEISPMEVPDGMFKVEFFSKDDLVFTEYVGDRNIAVDTAKTFVRQREKVHGK
jgi:hypothetical protein